MNPHKNYILIYAGLISALILFIGFKDTVITPGLERTEYARFINSHPYSTRQHLDRVALKKIPKKDRPDLAWEQDFLATMDPTLKRPTPEALFSIYRQNALAKRIDVTGVPGDATDWEERGPDNVGGRTRAIMFDPNDNNYKKVWAGGVTGGLWYNSDITNASSGWTNVDDFWANISVTCIAYDPNNTSIFYVGTGEGWGNGSGRGAGIWKTTDGGAHWSQLTASEGFYYVNDILVRDESGESVLYVGVSYQYYEGTFHGPAEGLYRSTDGGSTFSSSSVLGNAPNGHPYGAADIELDANNRLWVGTRRNAWNTYQADGSGSGTILYSDDGTNWTISTTETNGGRVELCCAPSDANILYAVIQNDSPSDSQQDCLTILRSGDNGSSWDSKTIPVMLDDNTNHFTRGQAWYDMILAVHPTVPNTVIVGGIDLHKSTDGGTNWTGISQWYGGYGKPYVHADQHQIIWRPGYNNQAVLGNDGGVYYSADIGSASAPSFTVMNNNYNVTQFYSCAIHPTSGTDYFLGGTQDNGSQQFSSAGMNSTTEVTGGDGAYCHIDQNNATYQMTSYVYNSIWVSQNGGASFFRPVDDQSTGLFINPSDYDDNQNILYSARTTSTVLRLNDVSGSPTVDYITISGMTSKASHLRVSPYTTGSTTLYVGTQSGDLYKVTNANTASPSVTEITGAFFPNGNISCVELGASENELLVTFSNYGVTSVWYSSNGGVSWSSKEGALPNMPVRWAVFNPLDRSEVLLATEVGVWKSLNFNDATPTWSSATSGLSNVRVDMLQVRSSDNTVLAATHGRGFFTGSFTYGPVRLQAKVFLEGPYDATKDIMKTTLNTGGLIPTTAPYSEDPRTIESIPADITDWVLVQLRAAIDGEAVASKSALLHKNGTVVGDDGTTDYIEFDVAEGNYYIVIQHRNHLSIESDEFHSLTKSSSSLYNFTTGLDKYKGGGAKMLESGVYGMYAGDTDHSGTVDANDRSATWNNRNTTGYLTADCCLSSTCDANSRSITWNNRNKSTNVQ